jgi:hypothetical protein
LETTRTAPNTEAIFEQGIEQLRALLGPGWEIAPLTLGSPEPRNLPRSVAVLGDGADRVLQIRHVQNGATSQLLVQALETVTPQQLRQQVAPKLSLMRQLTGDASILVLCPWLSPRTRALLDELDYGYLDLTGNVSFRLPRLGIVVRTAGATQSQTPTRAPWRQRLRGEKAGVLVRLLVDVAPPYGATQLARTSGLSLPYVSRLLDAMQDQALIEKRGRTIVATDWAGLLRERSAGYSLLKANPPVVMVSGKGTQDVLARLAAYVRGGFAGVAVTGSVAAAAVAPLTVGGQLMIHTLGEGPPGDLARALGLLPSATGTGNVLLLRSSNPVVFSGLRVVDDVPYVALSQLVLDCLAGTGRMPAEGEAVLEKMTADPDSWRLSELADWRPETPLGSKA